MSEREFDTKHLQQIAAIYQLQEILSRMVNDYTAIRNSSRHDARAIGREYAIAQRDYWGAHIANPHAQILRQIWTTALVKAGTENDWTNIKQAMKFDIVAFQDSSRPSSRQWSVALSNLIKLL